MKRAIAAFGVLAMAAVALAMLPATRDVIHWRWTLHEPAPKAALPPIIANVPEALPIARQELDEWDYAQRANTISSYLRYITTFPNGRFVQQAERRIATFRSDQALYEAAVTEASLRVFLADYPGHAHEADARQILKDMEQARDIVELLQENQIEVEAKGGGITKVMVRLRRLAPQPLAVRIPVGTFFVSSNPSAQNMVTTAESKVWLKTEEWSTVSPDAACANRPKRIPGGGDTFAVQRSPHQAELAKLMPVLERAKVDYKTRQAAVWIVTDNASYSDLGVLVVGGSQLIWEMETARALRICHEAGIDMTEKAIWKDRQRIIANINDSELKTWLEQMASVSDKKERERTIAYYTKEIERDPRGAAAYFNRGNAYQNNGDHDEAITDYAKAIDLYPRFAFAHNNRGFAHEAKGDRERAIAGYTKAIEIEPRFALAYNNRGYAYRAQGNTDWAIADYTKAIEIEPRFAVAFNNRGDALAAKGEHDRAIQDYDRAVAINPAYAEAYNRRGVAHEAKGDRERAIADFKSAAAIDGNQVRRDALKRLGGNP